MKTQWALLVAATMTLASAAIPGMQPRSAMAADPDPAPSLKIPWDWSGILSTGQSLSVGAQGNPVKSTTPSYNNLKLSTGDLPWPIDPNDATLSMIPLVEPVGRNSKGYPSSWPDNIDGETPQTTMASQITALVKAAAGRDFVSVQSNVGEDGQGMIYLKKDAVRKGVNGRSYEAATIEAKAITRLAKAAGKTYGIGAIIVTHGETDCGNPNYETELYQLWKDYNADLSAITGQTQPIQMIVSQQNSLYFGSTLAQWKIGLDHPAEVVCSGPKYQYPYAKDRVHLVTDGYRQLGEKYGQIYYERVIRGTNWQPLQPTTLERNGATITVHFHVPVPPLAWDTTFQPPHAATPEWKDGKGFEVRTADGNKMAITSAEISQGSDAVIITCAQDPGPGAKLSYALMAEKAKMQPPFAGTVNWGLLRDSDPFVGEVTKLPQPNYCVAFELTAP